VEASHGCSHRCRHCPVPVVYDGRVRVVDEDAVLADVAQLVAMGARHVTFGDPDFLNAPRHSMRLVRAVHERFPELTFDCTTKVEHVLRHSEIWLEMAASGCLFVVSAFESVDDAMLRRLDKGHTAADAGRATALLHAHGIDVRPSWLPFTPWTRHQDVVAILDFVHEHDLVDAVDPVQYTIRLLLPEGSLLLDDPELAPRLGDWDDARLTYDWTPTDPSLDDLQAALASIVERSVAAGDATAQTYLQVRAMCGAPPVDVSAYAGDRPHLTESWFCCAEPTGVQLRAVGATVPSASPGTRGTRPRGSA
jgi:radical SAM family protein